MNKVRAEEKALMICNAKHARTALISGEELAALEKWTKGQSSGFSERLKKLKILDEEDIPAIRKAITAAATKKAPPFSFCAPESLHIELTAKCPLNCPQCYKIHSQEELSFEFLRNVIEQADKMNVFQIALGGGEPLLYPHLLFVLGEISKCGIASSITTSGFGLDRLFLKRLQESGLNHIQISLNGSRNEIHSLSRDGFEYAIRAMELLQNSEISYGVNWVARRDNIDDFPNFIETAKNYRAHNINILRYKPSTKEEYADNDLTPENLCVLEKTIRNTKRLSIKVDSAFSHLLCYLNKKPGLLTGCGAGRRFLALDAAGFYRPCSHVELKERSDSLEQVWNHSPNLALFRSIPQRITEPCRTCTNFSGCFGCRAIVLAQGLNFFSGEKNCPFAKN